MEAKLRYVLPQHSIKRISHSGSTAVLEYGQKDIVDVLVEISTDSQYRMYCATYRAQWTSANVNGRSQNIFELWLLKIGFCR